MEKVKILIPMLIIIHSLGVNPGMCSTLNFDSSLFVTYDTSTPASRAMDKCVSQLKNGGKTREIVTLFTSAFENTGDDPGYSTELYRLALECKARKKLVDTKFWAFYGLTEAGHKYFRDLSKKYLPSEFIAKLKKAFLSESK